MQQVKKIIEYLEDEGRPFQYSLFTFFSAVVLRSLLEFMVSGSYVSGIEWGMPAHFVLFYIDLALTIVIILHLLSGESIERVSRAVAAGFIVIVTPPLVDLLLQLPWKYQILYLYAQPGLTHGLLSKYLLFFGDFYGVPPGVRLEVLMAMAGCAIYVYHKKASVMRAAAAALAFYTVLFWAYGAILFPIKWICEAAGFNYEPTNPTCIHAYMFLFLPLAMCVAYFYRPVYFKAIAKDLRPTRLLHYTLMVMFGLVIAGPANRGHFASLTGVLGFLFMLAALVFAAVFSIVTNNISDVEIDRISNPGRPSVSDEIPRSAYRAIGYAGLLLSLVYALAAGFMTLLLIACAIGCYYLYSMPPFRLKGVPILSKALIAFNSLVMVLAGYSFAGGNINRFPSGVAAMVLVVMSLCTNFIDIKDYEGDKAGGIKTLPVILGPGKAKVLTGLFFLMCYAFLPYLVGMSELFLPSLFTGILLFGSVTRKRYREDIVFSVYLLSGTAFWIYLACRA